MTRIALIFLLGTIAAPCHTDSKEHADLIYNISRICGERWEIHLGDGDWIHVESKEKVLGRAVGGNYPIGEEMYQLYVGFKVVAPIMPRDAQRAKATLEDLRAKAKGLGIERLGTRQRHYAAKTGAEWQLVLRIRKLEKIVQEIPDYRYKAIFLMEWNSMKGFRPNKDDEKAPRLMEDISEIYKLLTPNKSP